MPLPPEVLKERREDMPDGLCEILDLPDDAKVIAWTSYDTNHLGSVYWQLSLHVQVFPIWMLCFIAFLGGPAQLSTGLTAMTLLLPCHLSAQGA
jgi:hypothetical protein